MRKLEAKYITCFELEQRWKMVLETEVSQGGFVCRSLYKLAQYPQPASQNTWFGKCWLILIIIDICNWWRVLWCDHRHSIIFLGNYSILFIIYILLLAHQVEVGCTPSPYIMWKTKSYISWRIRPWIRSRWYKVSMRLIEILRLACSEHLAVC